MTERRPRRDILGEALRDHDQRTLAREDAGAPEMSPLQAAEEVVAYVASQYASASQMPGSRMLASIKHERFTQGLARGMTVIQASKFAGFDKTQPQLLSNPIILERLAYHRRLGVEAAGVTQERIARELAAIAFANARDAVVWGGGVIALKPSSELDDATAAAVSEVKRTQNGLAIKMHDKMGALSQLGKHLGMFVDKHEISGPNGKPIETISADMDPKKAAEAYMDLVKGT